MTGEVRAAIMKAVSRWKGHWTQHQVLFLHAHLLSYLYGSVSCQGKIRNAFTQICKRMLKVWNVSQSRCVGILTQIWTKGSESWTMALGTWRNIEKRVKCQQALAYLSEQLYSSRLHQHCAGTQRRTGGLALGATYSSKQATFFIEPCTKHPWDQETGFLEKASHSTLWGKDTKAHEQRRNWHGPQPRHPWYPSRCCLLKSLWQRWQGIELREENHRPPRRYWEYSPCILNWGRPKDMVEVRLVRSLG